MAHDGSHGTSRFRSANSEWGAWLRADTSSAAQNGLPAGRGITFVDFDPTTKRWNWVSIDAAGTYETRYSTSPRFSGSLWNNGYPAGTGTIVITVVNAKRYVADFTEPGARGGTDRSRAICTRP